MTKAILLLSGGIDSSTVLAMLSDKKFDIYALSFSYGQNHSVELDLVKELVNKYEVREHRIIDLDLSCFNSSLVNDSQDKVPKYKNISDIKSDIPSTYVPARNTIFLSYALGYAETKNIYDIFIGTHIQDSANYPDCTSKYIKSFESMVNIASSKDKKILIHSPLINMSKSEIVNKGLSLGMDYSYTISCYAPIKGRSCGNCHSCLVRIEAFKKNDIKDPILYIHSD